MKKKRRWKISRYCPFKGKVQWKLSCIKSSYTNPIACFIVLSTQKLCFKGSILRPMQVTVPMRLLKIFRLNRKVISSTRTLPIFSKSGRAFFGSSRFRFLAPGGTLSRSFLDLNFVLLHCARIYAFLIFDARTFERQNSIRGRASFVFV
jgi:hypothetical protein